jgi:hypothetical protein
LNPELPARQYDKRAASGSCVLITDDDLLLAPHNAMCTIPSQPPSKGGALAPLVASANFAHLRFWEVGWGNVPLDLCGVLVGNGDE